MPEVKNFPPAPGHAAKSAPSLAPTLAVDFAGIRSPNPFWLASAPPTNTGEMIMRAFDAGWGGAVWKTFGAPVTNVSSRYSSVDLNGRRMMGFNNIELISDRPTDVNLREITQVKKRYPNHAVIASLMVESKEEAWHDIVHRAEDAGADGLELNFGCPHGMNERGMGSAVGQVPEYTELITSWVRQAARTPVIVKLTPNITDIRHSARAAKLGGADAVSAINTLNSITGIDLNTFIPRPSVAGKSTHGGYCGPAVKPIALNMISQLANDPESALPISGIGGIATWQDAAEFILLGCTTVQLCTAVMHYGYRIVEDLADGLLHWMAAKGFRSINDFRGLTLPRLTEWKHLDLNYKITARINPETCIGCGLCFIACWDGAHQCIHMDRVPHADATGPLAGPLGSGPVDGDVALHATPAQYEALSRSAITVTPIPKLDRKNSAAATAAANNIANEIADENVSVAANETGDGSIIVGGVVNEVENAAASVGKIENGNHTSGEVSGGVDAVAANAARTATAADHGPYATPLSKIPRVDETECIGCNLCTLVCPVADCITMVELPTGLAPETWAQRTNEEPRTPPTKYG